MIRQTSFTIMLALSAGAVAGETVTRSETFEDRSGYPCFATVHTDVGKNFTLQLSDYKNVWSLNFLFSDRAAAYRQFYNDGSEGKKRLDKDAFRDAFGGVRIGESTFEFDDISTVFMYQYRQDVDEYTTAIFEIHEKHNVASTLKAMTGDGVEIPGLVALDGTADNLSEFRTCSYAAMGLKEGESVKTDYRAEYRMIFDGAFENWIAQMMRAENCLVARFDDEAVADIIGAAGDAFYPGILNYWKRGEYREGLERMLPLARFTGMADAVTDDCLMASRLADMSRIPVDRAIEAAAILD
jgi:hypothetical protein